MGATGAGPREAPVLHGMTLKEALEKTKRDMVLRAVEADGGNWAAAARSLGMARSNLHHMARHLRLRD